MSLRKRWRVERFLRYISDKQIAHPAAEAGSKELAGQGGPKSLEYLQGLKGLSAEILQDYFSDELSQWLSICLEPLPLGLPPKSEWVQPRWEEPADLHESLQLYWQKGWTNKLPINSGLCKVLQDARKVYKMIEQGERWSQSIRAAAQTLFKDVTKQTGDAGKRSKRAESKAGRFETPRGLLSKSQPQIKEFLQKHGICLQNLKQNEYTDLILKVWSEPGVNLLDAPWKESAEMAQQKSDARREAARQKSWETGVYKSKNALKAARLFLENKELLSDKEFLSLYSKICKTSVSDSTRSLTAQERTKKQNELLKSAQSPQHFLKNVTPTTLQRALKARGVDMKELKGVLEGSDWAEIILLMWRGTFQDIKAAAASVRKDVVLRKQQIEEMREQLMQVMWGEPDNDAQTCRNGAKCFLQSVPRTKLQQLCQALVLSGEGSNLADQIAQHADHPYAILSQLPEKMLQRAVAEYRLACGQEACSSDDSDDKDSAIAHLELQCEAAMLWGKFGDPKEARSEETDAVMEDSQTAMEQDDNQQVANTAEAPVTGQQQDVGKALGTMPEDQGTEMPVLNAASKVKAAGQKKRKQEAKDKQVEMAQQCNLGPSSVAKTADKGKAPAKRRQKAKPNKADNVTPTERMVSQGSGHGDQEVGVHAVEASDVGVGASNGPSPEPDDDGDDDSADPSSAPKEDPWEIMQDVVDQAQLVHYKDYHKDVGSEYKAQTKLMDRLKEMGYDVEDEVQLTSRVEKAAKVERNRVDLLINRKVLVELKHGNQLGLFHGQVTRYMKQENMAKICHHGLLIGFPKQRLESRMVTCVTAHRYTCKRTGELKLHFEADGMGPSPAVYKRCCN